MKNKSSLMIAVSAFALIGVITLAVLLSGCVNEEADKTIEILKAQGEDAYVLGSVVDGEEGVILC